MVPQQQIYIANYNLKNLAGSLSIPNIAGQVSSRSNTPELPDYGFRVHDKHDYGVMTKVVSELDMKKMQQVPSRQIVSRPLSRDHG
jgi:hypothetical protein